MIGFSIFFWFKSYSKNLHIHVGNNINSKKKKYCKGKKLKSSIFLRILFEIAYKVQKFRDYSRILFFSRKCLSIFRKTYQVIRERVIYHKSCAFISKKYIFIRMKTFLICDTPYYEEIIFFLFKINEYIYI